MSKPLAVPGEVVDLSRCLPTVEKNRQAVILKTQDVEITRLIIPAGSTIPTYEAAGQIIIHCLNGRVSIIALGESQELSAGQLLFLALNEAFAIHGIEDASVLSWRQ